MSGDPAMSVRPQHNQLLELLNNLVNWQKFGAFLPGIEREDIEVIECESSGVDQQKAALFGKWLRIHPEASWEDVLSALEKSREYTLASNVYQKCNEVITSSRTDVPLQGIITLIISLFYHDHSVATSTSQEVVNLSLENEEIQTILESLHKDFCNLMSAVRSALDKKLKRKKKMVGFIRWIDNYLLNKVSDINRCEDLQNVFEKLKPYFDFLQCKLIVDMSEVFLNDESFGEDKKSLVSELKKHMEKANTFSRLTTVKQLQDQLKSIYSPYLSNLLNMPKIQIQIHTQNPWNGVPIDALYLLIGHLLPYNSKQSILQHIEIIPGSIVIKYNVDEANTAYLIAYAQGKLQFMRLVGIFGLTINTVMRSQTLVGETYWLRETITNGESILKDEKNTNFNFDTALFEAAKIGHIEAAQFLIKIGANIDVAINEAGKVHQNQVAQFLSEWGDISTILGKFLYYTL